MADNTKYLKPFKKGYDPRRNTSGRKPRPDFATLLAEIDAEKTFERPVLHIAMRKLAEAAQRGESWAIKEIVDHVVGKAPQGLEIDAKHDGEIRVTWKSLLTTGRTQANSKSTTAAPASAPSQPAAAGAKPSASQPS